MKSVLRYLTTVLVCRSNNESHLGYWRHFGYHHLSMHCHTLHSTGRPLLCGIHRYHPAGFHYPQPGKSCAFLVSSFLTKQKSPVLHFSMSQTKNNSTSTGPCPTASLEENGSPETSYSPYAFPIGLAGWTQLLISKICRTCPEQSWLERREICQLKASIDLNYKLMFLMMPQTRNM